MGNARWRWLALFGTPVVLVVVLVLVWEWDWFIPLVESRASAAIGRQVTIAHLKVDLGRVTRLEAVDVAIANPTDFPAGPPFAQVARLGVRLDILDYLLHRRIVIPLIDVVQPRLNVLATSSGQNNYDLHLAGGGSGASSGSSKVRIERLDIEDGQAHVVLPALRADFHLGVATKPATGTVAQQGEDREVAVDATGTYAGQPVTGSLIGGSLLGLQDAGKPFPAELRLENGDTHVSLAGTVADPLALKGVDLRLTLSGASMAALLPLTGIPIPQTPPYKVSGHLTYADRRIRFEDIAGTVGSSDLEGTVAETPGGQRPDVTMELASRTVDLADLGGFIGAQPGGGGTNAEPAHHGAGLLPDTPIDFPRIDAADIHLHYDAKHIEGRSMPLDRLTVAMDVVDGAITLHPVSFGVGSGSITGTVALTPLPKGEARLKANADLDRVSLSRLMAATHLFKGEGTIGGRADIDATGNSLASFAAHGDGGLTAYMTGGDLSALLVSLSGLEFGNAVVAALGLPQQTDIRCFIGDLGLRRGIVDTHALLLDTGVAIVQGQGTVDLRDERIDYRIRSRPKHLSIGSLPAPIDITGTLADPSVAPAIAPLALRGAAAVALGFVAPPLALLATLQLGVNDHHECRELMDDARRQAKAGNAGAGLPAASFGTPGHPPAAPTGSGAVPAWLQGVAGKGDAAVRRLNQDELNHLQAPAR